MGTRLGRFAVEFVCGCALAFGVGMLADDVVRTRTAWLFGGTIGAIFGVAIGGWLIERPRRLNLIGLGLGWLLALGGVGLGAMVSMLVRRITLNRFGEFLCIVLPCVACSYVGWQAGKLVKFKAEALKLATMTERFGRFILEFVCGYAMAVMASVLVYLSLGADSPAVRATNAIFYGAPIGMVMGVAIIGWLIEKPRRLNLIGLGLGWLLAMAGLLLTFMFEMTARRIARTIAKALIPGVMSTSPIVVDIVMIMVLPCMACLAYVGWQMGRIVGGVSKEKEPLVS